MGVPRQPGSHYFAPRNTPCLHGGLLCSWGSDSGYVSYPLEALKVWSRASCLTSPIWFAYSESIPWYKYYPLVAELLLGLHALIPGLDTALVRVLETHFLGRHGRVGLRVPQLDLVCVCGR